MALVSTRLEDWLPEPLTVATRIVKSLTARTDMIGEVIRRVGAACPRQGERPLRRMESAAGGRKTSPMLALAHIILHVGFCGAIARAPAGTSIALRVRLTDRIGRQQVDKVFRFERGDDQEAIVEFDNAFGLYRLDLAAPKYRCSATDYLYFIPGYDRSITEKLSDSPAPPPPMPLLLSGTAPQSFLYVQPTFVLFDKSAVDLREAASAAAADAHRGRERSGLVLRLALFRRVRH